MNLQNIFEQIVTKKSFLCVGLDSDYNKLPKHLLEYSDPVFEFNKQIIDATVKYTIAYKPNLAFYETNGYRGWQSLEKTVCYIKKKYPEIFLIADAKRGDIGNTSKMYAQTFFEQLDFDAVTVAPYMGEDSIVPFLEYKNKFVIILALTSNKGANDFQFLTDKNEEKLFEKVLKCSIKWGSPENIMFVVGATQAQMLKNIRNIVPDNFLLVPGVGAQGGSLNDVSEYGLNNKCGLIVNSSRAIIFADNTKKFAYIAESEASKIQLEMQNILIKRNIS